MQPWTWQLAELFKVEKGKIHEIEALLHRVPYGMNSGWSTWSQGMSDVARDVTHGVSPKGGAATIQSRTLESRKRGLARGAVG